MKNDKLPLSVQEKINNQKNKQDLKQLHELGYLHTNIKVPTRLNKASSYNYKIKYTGLTAEAILYTDKIITGYERKHIPMRKENRTKANEQNLKRARKNVYDIVSTNYTEFTKMVTLTYAKTQLDYDRLYLDYKHFIENLKRQGYRFPYLAITENQVKRGIRENNAGSLHVHALLFTNEYIPFRDIKKAWGLRGSVHIEKIGLAEEKGAYVAKYITKAGMLPDKKSYRTSRNIKRPTFSVGLGDELDIISALGNDYNFKSYYNYTVIRGINQATAEIKEDLVAKVYKYTKNDSLKMF